jgi:hypothetical protein
LWNWSFINWRIPLLKYPFLRAIPILLFIVVIVFVHLFSGRQRTVLYLMYCVLISKILNGYSDIPVYNYSFEAYIFYIFRIF